jgi:hypothetical protein
VQVAEEVSREGEVTSSNPADRVATNFARKMVRLATFAPDNGPLSRLKIFVFWFFRIFLFRALPSVGLSAKSLPSAQ